jgi:uncharacterized RDD family membrane protein YckC
MVASSWRRLGAFAIDLPAYVVVSVPLWLVVFLVEVTVLTPAEFNHLSDHDNAVLSGALGGVTLLCVWGYETVTSASRLGGTLGKRILGMRVVSMTGSPLSVPRSFIRAIAKTFSLAAVGEGLLWLPFTPNRQALHDLLADSVVVVRAPNAGSRPLQLTPPMVGYRKLLLVLFTGSTAAVFIGFFAGNPPVMLAGFAVFIVLGVVGWLLRSRSARDGSLALQDAARPYLNSESAVLIALGERRLWSTGSGILMTLLFGWISYLVRALATQRYIVVLTPSSLVLIELDRSSRAKGLLARYPRSTVTVVPGRRGFGSRQLTIKAPDQEIPVIFSGIWAPNAKELQAQLRA